MYDSPLSTTPPSPRSRKQYHRRSQSPLPHLITLLPSNHSPSSRAADISRLLDPAYASSSSSSSTATSSSPQSQPRAYVDQYGDLHDPDYRDFPLLRPSARSSNPSKRRRASAGSAARSRSQERYSFAMHHPRPSWERDWATENADSDDDDDDEEVDSQSHLSPFASHPSSPRKSPSQPFGFPAYSSHHYYFPDAPSTSPSGSYDDEPSNALQLHQSPFEDDAGEVIEESRKTACLIRKASKPKKTASPDPQTEKDSEQSSLSRRPINEDFDDMHDTTPTCTHVLRQQWQAMTLWIRFGVFHTKRRLQGRRRRTA